MNEILFGILVPAGVLLASFLVTWKLYRHFSGAGGNDSPRKG